MSIHDQFESVEKRIRSYRQEEKDSYLNKKECTKKDYEGNLSQVDITFDTYQEGTAWSAQYPKEMPADVYLALGLAGETGELVENTKKRWHNDKGVLTDERKEKILAEAGDVLYFLSALMLQYGIKMSDVAKYNQIKLVHRMKNKEIGTNK